MGLSEDKRDELLIRVDERVENLIKRMDEFITLASGQSGFNRCAARLEKIEHIERNVKAVQDNRAWFERSFIGFILVAIAKWAYEFLSGS